MNTRFPILMVLTFTTAVSSAWAGDVVVQGEVARALQRAESFIGQKQYEKAAAECERASELAAGSCPECLLGVARAYSGAGQLEAAIQVTRMALPLFSSTGGWARAYDQLGSLLALKGDMEAAREAFRKAVALDGTMETQVRSSLAAALLKRAVAAEAAAARKAAVE